MGRPPRRRRSCRRGNDRDVPSDRSTPRRHAARRSARLSIRADLLNPFPTRRSSDLPRGDEREPRRGHRPADLALPGGEAARRGRGAVSFLVMSYEEILGQAMALPENERGALAEQLIESLGPEDDDEIDPELMAVVER